MREGPGPGNRFASARVDTLGCRYPTDLPDTTASGHYPRQEARTA